MKKSDPKRTPKKAPKKNQGEGEGVNVEELGKAQEKEPKKVKYISKFYYKGEARYKVRHPNYKIRSFKTMREAERSLSYIKYHDKAIEKKEIRFKKEQQTAKKLSVGVDDILSLSLDALEDIRRALAILPKGESLYKAVNLLRRFNAEKEAKKTPRKKTALDLALDEYYTLKKAYLSASRLKTLGKQLYSLKAFSSFKVRNIDAIYKPLEALTTKAKQAYISTYKAFFLWAWRKNKNYNARRIYKFLCEK